MTVINFPGHQWYRCTNKHCHGCAYCNGGLAHCKRCGGGEGSLPTDCPGQRMDAATEKAVYAGTTDYVHGLGWVTDSSINSPAHYR